MVPKWCPILQCPKLSVILQEKSWTKKACSCSLCIAIIGTCIWMRIDCFNTFLFGEKQIAPLWPLEIFLDLQGFRILNFCPMNSLQVLKRLYKFSCFLGAHFCPERLCLPACLDLLEPLTQLTPMEKKAAKTGPIFKASRFTTGC